MNSNKSVPASVKEGYCTHLNIVYRPVGGNAIGWTPRWICYDCGCEFVIKKDEIFINHIKNHLEQNQNVICKICGKSVDEIYEEQAENIGNKKVAR